MGAWGSGLYQNDAALDVRGVYRDCKKIGFRESDLASVVLETAAVDTTGKDEDSMSAYLALADLLWKDGMLSDDIRRVALRFIDEAQAADAKQRTAWNALRARLASLQPAPTPVRRRLYVEQCDFEIGEVLAFPWPKGKWALLRVAAFYTKFRGRSPICEVLDWRKGPVPSASVMEGLPLRRQRGVVILGSARPKETVRELIEAGRLSAGAVFKDYEDQMASPYIPLIRLSERDPHFHLAQRTGMKITERRPFISHWYVPTNAWTGWKDLPDRLHSYFGRWPAAKWEGNDPHGTAPSG